MAKSIIQTNKEVCYWCRKTGILHPHHVFNGAYKKKSEEDGMIVFVHDFPCHRQIHDIYQNELEIKQNGQRLWEQFYGTREEFIERYGKSYLWKEG